MGMLGLRVEVSRCAAVLGSWFLVLGSWFLVLGSWLAAKWLGKKICQPVKHNTDAAGSKKKASS